MKTAKLFACSLLAVTMFAACEEDPGQDKVLYTVTVTDDGNGTATASAPEAEAGAEVTLTATPGEGYLFDKWTVTEGNVVISDATENPVTIIMPAENIAVSASFIEEKVPHAINVTAPENGTIAVTNDLTEALSGETVEVTATPADGFDFVKWTVTGVDIAEEDLTSNPLSFVMPDNEVTVSAEFEKLVNVLDFITDEVFGEYVLGRMEKTENVTDPVTGESVLTPAWDTNLDGILTPEEAAQVKYLVFDGPVQYDEYGFELGYIASLDGIEYFTGLEVLHLYEIYLNYEGEIDLSALENLVYVSLEECSYYGTDLILGNKPVLKTLKVGFDLFSDKFDLSGCTKLTYLDFDTSEVNSSYEIDVSMIEDPQCVIKGSRWCTTLIRKEQEEAFIKNNTNAEGELRCDYRII